MPSATIKLATNIPLLGSVKYMDFYPEKVKDGTTYSAQVGLKGTWDGHGDGTVYLPAPLVNKLLEDGLAHADGTKAFQGATVPQFRWDFQGKVRVLKSEQGQKRYTTVTPADAAPTNISNAGPGPITAPSAVATGKQVFAPPKTVLQDGCDVRFAEMERTYLRCSEIATNTWGEINGADLVAATATLFIECNKKGLTVPEDSGAKQRRLHPTESFAGMPKQLEEAPDPQLPEWMQEQR